MGQDSDKGVKSVLVTRFSALGDVAIAVPVIYDVCRANPDVRFTFVTKPAVTSMFVNPPANLEVVGADVKHAYAGARGMWRLLRKMISTRNIDAVADLHDVIRTQLLRLAARLHGLKVSRLHKGRIEKAEIVGHSVEPHQLPTSDQRYRDVFASLGLRVDDTFVSVYGNDKGDSRLFAEITPAKRTGEKWIGIAPFAAHIQKIYPVGKMEQVVECLASDLSNRIFLFGGGGDEAATLGEWATKYPRVTSLAGKRYGFPKELALMSHLDVMVSMDSGNMHLASLTNTPVVSVWGATHCYCGFSGKGFRRDLAVELPLECRPCSVFGQKPCRRSTLECLEGIAPYMILEKVKKAIDERRG